VFIPLSKGHWVKAVAFVWFAFGNRCYLAMGKPEGEYRTVIQADGLLGTVHLGFAFKGRWRGRHHQRY